MSWTTEVIAYPTLRFLIVSCDTKEEKHLLCKKAEEKGWNFYQEGTVPDSGQVGIWFTKSTVDQTQKEDQNHV